MRPKPLRFCNFSPDFSVVSFFKSKSQDKVLLRHKRDEHVASSTAVTTAQTHTPAKRTRAKRTRTC